MIAVEQVKSEGFTVKKTEEEEQAEFMELLAMK